MKRALLIAGGTVGGLGAVLAITPPQLGANDALSISGASVGGSSGTAEVAPASSSSLTTSAKATASPKASAAASPTATKKASSTAGNSAAQDSTSSNSGTTSNAAGTATTAPVASSAKSINGTFTGPSVFVNYGNVQVKITVVNGRITDAVAVQAPSGRNDRWTNMAVPILKQQTLAAQNANIQGASGASYTSYGWYTSLQGALAQAGL
jgi:uncharacterized protein with FMN-binding domain